MVRVLDAPGFYLHSFQLKGKGTDLSLGCFSISFEISSDLAVFGQSEPIPAAQSYTMFWLAKSGSCVLVQG